MAAALHVMSCTSLRASPSHPLARRVKNCAAPARAAMAADPAGWMEGKAASRLIMRTPAKKVVKVEDAHRLVWTAEETPAQVLLDDGEHEVLVASGADVLKEPYQSPTKWAVPKVKLQMKAARLIMRTPAKKVVQESSENRLVWRSEQVPAQVSLDDGSEEEVVVATGKGIAQEPFRSRVHGRVHMG